MARENIERLVKRSEMAEEERQLNRHIYEGAQEYINPYKNGFSKKSKTHNTPVKQYDSSPMIAASNFQNKMQSDFTPPFSRWAEIKAGPGIAPDQRKAVNKELEKLTEVVFAYLNASNFANAKSEMDFDLGLGTGCMFVLEGDEQRPLNFVACPIHQIGIEEGPYGNVHAVFRKMKLKISQVKQRWKDANIPEELAKDLKDNPDKEEEFTECIYYDPENLVWYYDVIHEKYKARLVEREFSEDIALVPRWMKVPGNAFGLGPFTLALPDIRTLNKMQEFTLKMAALNVFGVYTVTNSGVFNPNSATIRPGAFIPVERNAGPNGPSIQQLPRAGDFTAQEYMVNQLKDQIRQVMLDNRLPAESAGVRTAFEIAERIKELQTDIGAAFGRIYFEFVQPLFRRIIAILERKGLIELPEGFDLDNFYYQVQIVSPIAQQQSVSDVQKLMQAIAMGQSILPELPLTQLKVEDIMEYIVEKLGAPSMFLRETDEKNALLGQIAQIVAQAQAAQQPQQQG